MKRLALLPIVFLALPGEPSPAALQASAPQDVKAAAQAAVAPQAARIIPDRFLRRWDPVTVFFDRDLGPAKGGPEDDPGRVVSMSPAHPGAFQWIDGRTLQFRPAEPWPSLARFDWTAAGKKTTLTTLMEAPVETVPVANADNLDPVDQITLFFAEPLEVEALARMTSIELRPLPGIGSAGARFLTREDFTVKTLERSSRSDRAGYVLALRQAIPLGTRAIVHLRLSLEDKASESFREVAFETAEPFRALNLGCRDRQYPVTPEGTRYNREQAIHCASGNRMVTVELSSAPKSLGPVEGRNLLRFTPAVPKLGFSLAGRTLEASGDFAWDTLYTVDLVPTPLEDQKGRKLDLKGPSRVFVFFPRKPTYVKWGAGQGIAERYGPETVPVEGRGQERVDVRIHRVDPLNRTFWPFPEQPVMVDESRRPPGPGEEPPPHDAADRNITPNEIARHLPLLGSPPVSTLVPLPLRREGGAARFGLDLAPHLAKVAGTGQPGTYLVGLRDIAGASQRAWMRIQVTDLSLATVEEPRAVRFVVTSLSTGMPVAAAKVRIEGTEISRGVARWTVFGEGVTDAQGAFRWPAPGLSPHVQRTVRRLVIEKDGDLLVLDASRPPERYADNQWFDDREVWLQWAFEDLRFRGPQTETLCHIFTERPVYRPEEDVHIKGYLRERAQGRLKPLPGEAVLVVEGPGDLSWSYPVTLGELGSFYHKFAESQLPTGAYRAHLENKKRDERWGQVSFRIEAYRIPRFEVSLHAPDRVPLDQEFEVSLTATYYAGGRVAARPLQWRVTQFPYPWSPKPREGFRYSSDARFSREPRFVSTPQMEKEDVTSETGSASIRLNPAIEPTAQPRSYLVEATVTGADDQTVTATRRIQALPPFVLGLKVPRFLERAKQIDAGLVVVGPDGKEMADKEVTVRLLRREWHSHLRASDFSDGIARYSTDVVDEKVSEIKVKSAADPLSVKLPVPKAGVYIVELESHDRLGRAQVVSADLYVGGDEPIAWPKPVTQVFSVATDKAKYDPGQTAAIVLKSPFQTARALTVVEAPEGNRYEWIPVEGGAATYRLPIMGTFTPRLPVHFVLMRGRIPGTAPQPGNATDLGKPATMAATAWLEVNPVANQAVLQLDYPETARPGQKIDVTITLKDPQGRPLAGEVTLWLVDQAVLALGKEQRLDPLPDFITPVNSHLSIHDTRNLAFGALPFAENPGGDEGEGGSSLLDRTTVRKNFKTVPYYNPAIPVGPDGVARVTIELSDDLTNFDLRAKVAAGPERFGFATGRIAVRLPVIVQPALPRFVRPGDTFVASAIGRVVEGPGGPGSAEVRTEGVRLTGPARRDVQWAPNRPERLDFPVEVPTPTYTEDGRPSLEEATFRMAVERASDRAADAFEVKLPIRPDRERITRRTLEDLVSGKPLALPALPEKARPGTVRRSVLASDQSALVRMAAGLDFLLAYPYGCTEQKLSRARAMIALRKFRTLLKQSGSDKEVERGVRDVMSWLPSVVDGNGLVAYWPGSNGYVSLTAWTVQFVVESREAGFPVDDKLLRRLLRSLEQALRSDYSRFIDGESYLERAWALTALAQAGQFDAAYASELSRKAQFLHPEGVALVLQALARAGEKPTAMPTLTKSLWDNIVFRLHQGKEIYGGLQDRCTLCSGLVLPSETRTVAETTRALSRLDAKAARFPVLIDALVTLGRDDGWGTTNANASALLALSEILSPPFPGAAKNEIRLRWGGREQKLSLGPDNPIASLASDTEGAGEVLLETAGGPRPVVVRSEASYLPAEDGSRAAASSSGFVVSRELLRVVKDGAPPARISLAQAGTTINFAIGDVVEEHVQIVNPKDRHYVAVVVPLAAGMEILNPALATAPPDAAPTGKTTRPPTYVAFLDDQVGFYYDTLPAGSYDFYFRTRASTPGSFIEPPAKAEMMYDGAVRGNGNGARIVIERKP